MRDLLSDSEQELARRAPRFELGVGLGGLGEWKDGVHAEPQFARLQPREEIGGARHELVARGNVLVEARPREEEGALGTEDRRIERRDGAARKPEQRQHATSTQAVQTLVERVLPDGVVYDIDTPAVG